MMGLEQIKEANENPTEYAKSNLSAGQRRRNDDKGKAYWSEVEHAAKSGGDVLGLAHLSSAADQGRTVFSGEPVEEAPPIGPVPNWARVDMAKPYNLEVINSFKRAQGEHPIGDQRGRFHGLEGRKEFPNIYFDALSLNRAIRDQITELYADSRKLISAIQMLQTYNSQENAGQLQIVFDALATPELRIRMEVNALSDTINAIAPEPKGYTPHMGINYALAPIKAAIARLRNLV